MMTGMRSATIKLSAYERVTLDGYACSRKGRGVVTRPCRALLLLAAAVPCTQLAAATGWSSETIVR